MTVTWCLVPEIWNATDRISYCFGPFFALLCPPPQTTPKIKILKNWNKTPGDIIILHMCTINYNDMMYSSWDIKDDRQNFWLLWTVFCLFTPLTTQKIFEKIKQKYGDVIILHMATINDNHMMYGSQHMKHGGQNFFCHFGLLCHFTFLTNQKIKSLKNWKKMPGDTCFCFISNWNFENRLGHAYGKSLFWLKVCLHYAYSLKFC